jgi:hypothetical protein
MWLPEQRKKNIEGKKNILLENFHILILQRRVCGLIIQEASERMSGFQATVMP